MSIESKSLNRRGLLRGALAAAVLVPLGGTVSSCAAGGSGQSGSAPTAEISAGNPFGLSPNTSIDAVVFNGGYGIDYVQFAADIVKQNVEGLDIKVSPSNDISGELQPRFVGGTPPDLFDNSGAKSIGVSVILDQLEDLSPVLDANNLEGAVIRDTLYPGVEAPGTFDGKLAQLNYVLTVYAVWYSQSLFDQNGWTPPRTWDEALELGAQADVAGKKLFSWGQEAATYYMLLAVTSAIKEGGDDVRLALENLQPDAWSQPALQSVLGKIAEAVQRGYFIPGGAGTPFKVAQAAWSNNQQALLYPSGSWIENEMKDQARADFQMAGFPAMTVSANPAMPYAALYSAAGEPFAIPSKAKNQPGAKELLRTMLSKEAASNFARTKLAPTIVKDTIPEDGFGSTALVSQMRMLNAAGTDVFTVNFNDFYGTNKDFLTLWNAFLSGNSDVATLTNESQKIFDRVRNDSSIKKVEVK
ncbi:N-acetylglucosamine/diacetylchitobiose ABC transporter substrate-binding protein [Acaricomes phytoseiuli]|uniref:N-acetylglucosamine/diacetylchitobiose ABC transporter substrate-binding protein n=1 Tax=Acaricomes phytoseiuli TaxID=291968 RepID=UPI00037250EF|nr:N-acetylglucosamine/diacetylchitobiose ABC transporter substrate-binding protein [Acaricomes phytoseiuli]MCW1248627.1 N-acetylglucosamine/diacetylchitobiose ABC transporter substrate-binding protein [Acaricomes phytoseiuli]